jgi:basic membrane protein A and related proteins
MSGLRKRHAAFAALAAAVAVAGVFVFGASGHATKTYTIGAALIGPKNDKSFNQAAYQGILQAIKQNPGKFKLVSTLENRATDQQRTQAIETLAPLVDIVVAVSNSFGPILDAEAAKFPTKYFLIVAGYTAKYHKNVTGFANEWGAPAFVGGAIAATLSKTGTVGYVGGYEIPPTTQAAAGFRHGAQLINPKIKVLSNITGDFNDVAKAKQATAAELADGADVIFPFLDAGIAGAYAAGKATGKNPAMFKLTIPDCTSYPNIVGTEVENNTLAVSLLLKRYTLGKLLPGAIFQDLQDPPVATMLLCPRYKKNAKVAAVTKRIIAGLNSGKIKYPADTINPRPKYQYTEGLNSTKIINKGKG